MQAVYVAVATIIIRNATACKLGTVHFVHARHNHGLYNVLRSGETENTVTLQGVRQAVLADSLLLAAAAKGSQLFGRMSFSSADGCH